MLDAAGKELSVGQVVVMTVSGYEELKIGTVYAFTPKKIKILTKEKVDNEFIKFPNQVAVIAG